MCSSMRSKEANGARGAAKPGGVGGVFGKAAPRYGHPLGDLGLIACCGPYGRGR